ncbi:hypothetical protein D3C84_1237940 [compost metagenome]
MNAENAPKLLQSLAVAGLKKLNANIMKIAELMKTSAQRPYADSPWFIRDLPVYGYRASRRRQSCSGLGDGAHRVLGA